MNGLVCSPRELLADFLELERSGVGFMVYPNLVDELVTLEHLLPQGGGYAFRVVNALGHEELWEDLVEGDELYEWDTSGLQQGLYYVFLYQDELLVEYRLLSILH
jgi:hypothetical protein